MPSVWLIDAYRAGERGQLRALAEALEQRLGWRIEIIPLSYRRRSVLPHLLRQTTLRGIPRSSRRRLRPPWPDWVISSGVRNEPVCRWIRAQSGGKTRYAHIGRPWAAPAAFDLVVTTPQYRIPPHPHVLNNGLTLHNITPETLAAAAAEWRDAFADLPPPYIAVLAGGDSGPFTFGPRAAARLGAQAAARGGSLLISTSSRTRPKAATALRQAVEASGIPHYFYNWRERQGADNPYRGILALADELIVTADSIAMLSEACGAAKPVWMFDTGGMRPDAPPPPKDFRLGASLYAALLRHCWQPLTRDITQIHTQLHSANRAAWLPESPPSSPAQTPPAPPPAARSLPPPPRPGSRDLDQAVNRLQALTAAK